LNSLIGPMDDFIISNSLTTTEPVQNCQDVVPHQLPYNGQSQGLVAIEDILALNTDKRELKASSNFDSIVVVLQFLPGGLRVLVDLAPVDATGFNLIKELEEDVTIPQINVKVVNEGINTERIHPVPESLLFSGLFDDFWYIFNGLKCGPCVEQVGDESQIQLLVASYDISGLQELAAVDLGSVIENHLGPLQIAGSMQSISVAVLRGDLSKKDCIGSAVLDIGGKVVYPLIPTGVLQVVVEPTQKDLIDGELQQIFNGLTFFKEAVKFGVVHQVDFAEKANLHDLPDETKDKMWGTYAKERLTEQD